MSQGEGEGLRLRRRDADAREGDLAGWTLTRTRNLSGVAHVSSSSMRVRTGPSVPGKGAPHQGRRPAIEGGGAWRQVLDKL